MASLFEDGKKVRVEQEDRRGYRLITGEEVRNSECKIKGNVYRSEMVDAMIKKFGYKNIMEVPKLDKIVVNMGVGEAKENAKAA